MKLMRVIPLFLFSLSFYVYSDEKSYELVKDKCTLEILNPDLSQRKTAKVRLKNGLEAYLISDPGADQSAASLAVEVGCWSDPEAYPGTAHFLEHMLFMGNGAYPEEEGFFKYVLDNSGTLNAYTMSDRTVYMFSINHEAFDEGLDRFSHFFIDPLLNPSGIGRELHAVDQENDKNVENDTWREWMIFKETGNSQHPNAKFSTGNAKTLGKIPQQVLKEWFDQHYSANLMHLVVYSPLPLDQLVELVSEDFSKIPNTNATKYEEAKPLTSLKQKKHLIYVEPVKDLRQLTIAWELSPEEASDITTKSAEFVAYALGHGHQNGLVEKLKKEGLIDSLNVEMDRLSKQNVLMLVRFGLTQKGVSSVEQILERTYQTISLMKLKEIPMHLYQEMQVMSKIHYEYQSRQNAFSFVMHHAHQLVDEPLETYPQYTAYPSHYSARKIEKILYEMTPDSAVYFLTAPETLTRMKPTTKEKWLGGEYSMKKISEEFLIRLGRLKPHPQLALPKPNPYLPTSLKLIYEKDDTAKIKPKLIADDSFGKAYFLEDHKYCVPKTMMYFNLRSPKIDGSPMKIAMLDLYLKGVNDKLSPELYNAASADLYSMVNYSEMKLVYSIQGYSEKAPRLLDAVVTQVKNFDCTEEKFKIYKEQLLSEYENRERSLPYYQAHEIMTSILFNDSPTTDALREHLKEISYEEFMAFSKSLFSTLYVEGTFAGNLTESEALTIWKSMKNTFSPSAYPPSEHNRFNVLLLPKEQGPFMYFEKTNRQGNAAVLMLQEGTFSFEKRASQLVLEKALAQAFFNTLRTKQQTAYIAKSWANESENQLLHFFSVQSSTHNPIELISRFELFLEDYVKDFETNLPKERFENIRQMLISKWQMPLPSLEEHAMRAHLLAFTYKADFDRIDKNIAALKGLTYETFKEDAIEFVSRKNGKRLAVLLEGILAPDKDFRYKQVSPDFIKEVGIYVSKEESSHAAR